MTCKTPRLSPRDLSPEAHLCKIGSQVYSKDRVSQGLPYVAKSMSHDMHACACFMCMLRVSITSAASPASTHPSIKGASRRLHRGGPAAFGRRSPFVTSFMDGCVGDGEAADVMETRNIHIKHAHACISCDIDLAI